MVTAHVTVAHRINGVCVVAKERSRFSTFFAKMVQRWMGLQA